MKLEGRLINGAFRSIRHHRISFGRPGGQLHESSRETGRFAIGVESDGAEVSLMRLISR